MLIMCTVVLDRVPIGEKKKTGLKIENNTTQHNTRDKIKIIIREVR